MLHGMSAPTAAEMVAFIDEAIAGLMDPARGAAIKKSGSQAGVMMEAYDLSELRDLRREYKTEIAEAASDTGMLSLSKVTNREPS